MYICKVLYMKYTPCSVVSSPAPPIKNILVYYAWHNHFVVCYLLACMAKHFIPHPHYLLTPDLENNSYISSASKLLQIEFPRTIMFISDSCQNYEILYPQMTLCDNILC